MRIGNFGGFSVMQNLLTTHHACVAQGSNEILPTLSIFSQFFNGAPAVIEPP